jgi:ABC-2 type transport system ATP-binding protein
MTRAHTRIGALMAAAALVVGACSSSDAGDTPPASGDRTAVGPPVSCDRPEAAAPAAVPVEGTSSDLDVTSFDGTTIRAHWFPHPHATADEPAPTVLMGPGWGQPGDTDVDGVGLLGAMSIGGLHDHGFNVLTWDPRGFGASSGTVEVNSADAEARDVGVLLDWVATQPVVQLDAAGDPRSGMIGGSYGGGIQLVTAAVDCRVDALVPVMAWHSLETSLYKAETPKAGWANLLYRAAAGRELDPHLVSAARAMNQTGTVDPADIDWFAERGPGDLVGDIAAPTLFVQGTVDTLFTLDEAITSYGIMRGADVPVAMLWYCGGHGTCLTSDAADGRVGEASIAWLERYVKGDTAVDTGPRFQFVDQNGVHYTADDYPLAEGTPVTASGSGTLELVAGGGAGPVADPPPPRGVDMLRDIVLPITPGRAANAVDVAVPAPADPVLVVGAPRLELTYRGTADPGVRPTRVFAQVVDEASGLVLGNQVTPIEVVLDGEEHTTEVSLEVIAHALTPDSRLTVQIAATTVAYAPPRLGGSVTFDAVAATLPVAADITPET